MERVYARAYLNVKVPVNILEFAVSSDAVFFYFLCPKRHICYSGGTVGVVHFHALNMYVGIRGRAPHKFNFCSGWN